MSAKRVKNVASSTAESPPPTTAIVCSRKKKPSHVAHQETPWPDKRFSLTNPISRYALPIARMTDLALTVFPEPSFKTLISPDKSISTMSSVINSVPKRFACFRILSIKSGPMTPSINPGKFSTSVVFMSAPPAVTEPS